MDDSDWTCEKCGSDNPIWRIDCQDCGSPRWKYINTYRLKMLIK